MHPRPAVRTAGQILRLSLPICLAVVTFLWLGKAASGSGLTGYPIPGYPMDMYMPVVIMPPPAGIVGRVTYQGMPIGGITLDLRFYDGSSWSTYSTRATSADGEFVFDGLPSLGAGQKYYVRYSNPEGNSSRLAWWLTRDLDAYTSNTMVDIGSFDIANVELLAPAPGAGVTLPYTFRWRARPATQSDSYGFNVYDYDVWEPWFSAYPLGYTDNYTLAGLPGGFATLTWYVWDIDVYSPDGGVGTSYWAYYVYFASGVLAADNLPERLPAASVIPTLRGPEWPIKAAVK